MKRLLLLFIVLLSLSCAFAQNFSDAQKKLRSDIMLFLKEEGYMPELDSDGDIIFKKEGGKYYVQIDERDTSPLYLKISLPYIYNTDFSAEKVAKALKELNSYKGVKVVCFDRSYSYHAEVYLVNSEHFKYTFYKLMSQIEELKKELASICTGQSTTQTSLERRNVNAELLPILGIDFNTTESQLKTMNYTKKEKDGERNKYVIESIWVYTKNEKVQSIIIGSYDTLPANLIRLGFDKEMSYNQWVQFLANLGFMIQTQHNYPSVKKNGSACEKYFTASFRVANPDKGYTIYCDFSSCGVASADDPIKRPFISIAAM